MNVKKDDKVIVLSGKDKGKQGRVLYSEPKTGRVIVEGINIASRHRKPRQQGEEGGIIKMEVPLRASKVMRICPKCDKPTRLAHSFDSKGVKSRVCKKCGERI